MTQSVIDKDQMTAVENSLEVLQNVGKNLKNVQALIPLLLNYFQKVSVSRWEAPIAEPEMLTTRSIYDRNNPTGSNTYIRRDIRTFPIISSGSDSPSAYEDFICVLPITTHEKPWGVIEASGLVGKGWARLQAKMMQYIELIAPAFERAALDEELVSYQMGLEELVRQRTAELREKTEQLREAKEWAESASAAKTTFLANMSHELRSPLNAILGFSRLLTRKPGLSDTVKDDLRIILSSGEHLYELINQVLNLAKIEAGRTTLDENNFDLYETLDELKDMFHLVTKQKQLQLQIEIDATIPRYIKADAVKLRQILINLVNNALKFTSKGSVTIRITKENETNDDTASCRILFAVIDTGPGIAPEELDMLSVAFVQANAGRHAQEGTGLGLAISRGFVEVMGGKLRLASQLGKGTTVEFAIPVHIVTAEISAADVRKSKATIVGLAPDQPIYRILAVDDRAASRQMLDRLLTPCGFEVRQASNGEEALDIWQAWDPHLIFMDMRMPVMSGQEAIQRIKATTKGKATVIIALTASSFEEEREQLLSIGCDDFLRKPFQENMLFEVIHKHLGAKLIYETDEQPPIFEAVDKDRLLALPTELREQLADAINCFDDERIESVIATIYAHDAVLGDTLNTLATRFSYDLVLNLLKNKS